MGVVPHLVNFVPFWVEALLDRLALEQLVTDLQHAVRVRLSLYEPPQKLILPFQVQSLQEVDSEDPLQRPSGHEFSRKQYLTLILWTKTGRDSIKNSWCISCCMDTCARIITHVTQTCQGRGINFQVFCSTSVVSPTFGIGKRSWASSTSPTSGMVTRLGRTR